MLLNKKLNGNWMKQIVSQWVEDGLAVIIGACAMLYLTVFYLAWVPAIMIGFVVWIFGDKK